MSVEERLNHAFSMAQSRLNVSPLLEAKGFGLFFIRIKFNLFRSIERTFESKISNDLSIGIVSSTTARTNRSIDASYNDHQYYI
jgi:hypothetical protein